MFDAIRLALRCTESRSFAAKNLRAVERDRENRILFARLLSRAQTRTQRQSLSGGRFNDVSLEKLRRREAELRVELFQARIEIRSGLVGVFDADGWIATKKQQFFSSDTEADARFA